MKRIKLKLYVPFSYDNFFSDIPIVLDLLGRGHLLPCPLHPMRTLEIWQILDSHPYDERNSHQRMERPLRPEINCKRMQIDFIHTFPVCSYGFSRIDRVFGS